jgi:hypothetical protein
VIDRYEANGKCAALIIADYRAACHDFVLALDNSKYDIEKACIVAESEAPLEKLSFPYALVRLAGADKL